MLMRIFRAAVQGDNWNAVLHQHVVQIGEASCGWHRNLDGNMFERRVRF